MMGNLAIKNGEDKMTDNALALIEGKTELVFTTANGLDPLINAVKPDKAHQKKINNEALHDICLLFPQMPPDSANNIGKAVIEAIAKGEIRHTKINY